MRLAPTVERRIMPLFQPMERAATLALEPYSDKELERLLDFLQRTNAAAAALAELREQAKAGDRKRAVKDVQPRREAG